MRRRAVLSESWRLGAHSLLWVSRDLGDQIDAVFISGGAFASRGAAARAAPAATDQNIHLALQQLGQTLSAAAAASPMGLLCGHDGGFAAPSITDGVHSREVCAVCATPPRRRRRPAAMARSLLNSI